MINSQSKLIKKFVRVFVFGILSGCYAEPEFVMQRVPYEGNELRIDGYYYHSNNSGNAIRYSFLFRNGVIYYEPYWYSTNDLNELEQMFIKHKYEWLKKYANGWGIFVINGNRLELETWDAEGGLLRYVGRIENDTTMHLLQMVMRYGGVLPEDKIFHFKKFSPKPDSIKSFIK